MLPRQFLSCLALIVVGQMVGGCLATILAMEMFPVFDVRAFGLIVTGALAGLAISLLILCGIVSFKTPDDGEPPLGIGA